MATAEDIKSMMARRASIPVSELNPQNLRDAGCDDRVAVLPKDHNEKLSYLANVLVQATCGYPKSDDRLRAVINELGQAFCYMMNSTSWLDGELHDFDYDELKRKLRRIVR